MNRFASHPTCCPENCADAEIDQHKAEISGRISILLMAVHTLAEMGVPNPTIFELRSVTEVEPFLESLTLTAADGGITIEDGRVRVSTLAELLAARAAAAADAAWLASEAAAEELADGFRGDA